MKVQVQQLRKEFGKTVAVDNISFAFDSGHIFGFVGPNGAGKTTTMRIIATIEEPTDGDVLLNGVSVREEPELARRVVGYVPDTLPSHADITVHEYLDFYARAYGLPLAVTRFANVYGGGDLNFSRLVPETVVAVLDGRAPQIRSDGSPERDFLHVDDAVAAYLAIASALGENGTAGQAFNAGGDRPHSVREVVELIAAAGGGAVAPDYLGEGSPDGEIDRQFVDSSKLRDLTGWRPEVELSDGLSRTLEWYREHPEARPRAAL